MTTQLVLVRHATCARMDSVLFGRAVDSPLDQHGREQARALARTLASRADLVIEASPRRRTRQTAAAIAAAHGGHVRTSAAIDEIDFGRWSGCSFDTLQNDPEWRYWNERRSAARTPSGIAIADVRDQLLRHLHESARSHPFRCIAIVTHAEIIRTLVMHWLNIPVDDYNLVQIRPASMTTISMDGSGTRVEAVSECPAP